MPLRSKAQLGFLMANKPKLGREFIKKTPSIKSLPARVGEPSTFSSKFSKIGR